MNPGRIQTADFDPFQFSWLFKGFKNKSTGWVSLATLSIPALVFIACWIDGTVGGVGDMHVTADLSRILKLGHPTQSRPSFPLLRDIYSWTQAFTVMSGTILLHRQWQHMSRTLSRLAASEAIVARAAIRSNIISRALGIDRLIRGVSPTDALNVLVSKTMTALTRFSALLQLAILLAAFFFAELLVLGQQRNLFQVLAPDDLTPQQSHTWLLAAYHSWWAGESHIVGHLTYLFLAVYAIFLILNFEIPGLVATYIAGAMFFVVDTSADWLNRDGRFGWKSLAMTFRTVVLGNLLLAFTLTDVLVFIGADNFTWIFGLLGLYIVVVPLFVLVPWFVFHRAESRVKQIRIEELHTAMGAVGLDAHSEPAQIAAYLNEIARCHGARIQPLRVRRWSLSTFIVLVLVPVVLAAAQIFFQFRLGTR